MADIIADLAVRIGAVVSPYNAALADAAVNGERFTALQMANADAIREANRQTAAGLNTVKVAAEAVGVAVAASAAEDLKWATQFQTQVTRLYTQAGLNSKQLADAHLTTDGLKKELLQLGDDAGFAGDQVAAALYYPISSGIALAQALAMVDQAERASRISGAALTDTTIALTSVMRGYGSSLSDPAKAMAQINAIVGQGMMVFGDFNASVKGWEPTAATLKVDLMSAGAALDFLTDRGDTAATAGTRVSMMLAMMVGQTKQAAKFTTELGLTTTDAMSTQAAFNKVLKDSGLTVSELADDLQKPDGIFVALSHLRTAMSDHGMSEDAQNALLTKLFGGGKSFRGVAELTTQLDQLQVKYNQITAQANGDAWQQAWATNSATLAAAARRDRRPVPQRRHRGRRLHDPEDLARDLLAGEPRGGGVAEVLGRPDQHLPSRPDQQPVRAGQRAHRHTAGRLARRLELAQGRRRGPRGRRRRRDVRRRRPRRRGGGAADPAGPGLLGRLGHRPRPPCRGAHPGRRDRPGDLLVRRARPGPPGRLRVLRRGRAGRDRREVGGPHRA